MTNNDIFKKLRVALMLRDDDIIEILKLADFELGKSELGAFFRKEDHPNYRECGDQILRNFLNGLVIYLRGTKENPRYPGDILKQNKAIETQKRPSFKTQQRKQVDTAVNHGKYKNKPARSKGNKKP